MMKKLFQRRQRPSPPSVKKREWGTRISVQDTPNHHQDVEKNTTLPDQDLDTTFVEMNVDPSNDHDNENNNNNNPLDSYNPVDLLQELEGLPPEAKAQRQAMAVQWMEKRQSQKLQWKVQQSHQNARLSAIDGKFIVDLDDEISAATSEKTPVVSNLDPLQQQKHKLRNNKYRNSSRSNGALATFLEQSSSPVVTRDAPRQIDEQVFPPPYNPSNRENSTNNVKTCWKKAKGTTILIAIFAAAMVYVIMTAFLDNETATPKTPPALSATLPTVQVDFATDPPTAAPSSSQRPTLLPTLLASAAPSVPPSRTPVAPTFMPTLRPTTQSPTTLAPTRSLDLADAVFATPQSLLPEDTWGDAAQFASAVALSRDGGLLAVAIAYAEQNSRDPAVGAVQVYERNGDTWTPRASPVWGLLGDAVTLDGDYLVTSDSAHNRRTGQVQLYQYDWDQQEYHLTATLQGEAASSVFGSAIAIRGHHLAVGAPYHSTSWDRRFNGQVFLYERQPDEMWTLVSTLHGDGSYDRFGSSLALADDGTMLVVGAPHQGYVKVFEWDGVGAWIQLGDTISSSNDENSNEDRFGHAVSISRSLHDGRPKVAVSTSMASLVDPDVSHAGAVAVYQLQDGAGSLEWSQILAWNPVSLLLEGDDKKKDWQDATCGQAIQLLRGSVLAVACPGYRDQAGTVLVYSLLNDDTTSILRHQVVGDAPRTHWGTQLVGSLAAGGPLTLAMTGLHDEGQEGLVVWVDAM